MMQRAEASEWNIKRAIARLVLSPPPPRSSFYLHSADAALMQFVEVSSPPPSSSLYLHFVQASTFCFSAEIAIMQMLAYREVFALFAFFRLFASRMFCNALLGVAFAAIWKCLQK
jgi:hypothetical protein